MKLPATGRTCPTVRTYLLRRLGALLLVPLAATLAACAKNDDTSKIDYSLVTVGDPGNAADSTGFGAVAYTYRIGKYPVTVGEYASFLNAVARADPNGLYEPSMGSDLNVAGISRTGNSGGYVYAVIDNKGDTSRRPIAYVSWFNAARFANWMDNGQPVGAQGSANIGIRGGAWTSLASYLASTYYLGSAPYSSAVNVGLRLAGPTAPR